MTFVQSVQNPDDSLGIRTVYQYIWLGDIPVAQFREQYQADGTHIGSQLVYIHANHLYTPRIATGTSEVSPGVFEDDIMVWSTFGYDYGQTIEFSDPDADLETVNIALRFPGQVYYGIGNFNYNYYRDYEAFYGRYLESDPIGLNGGPNSFAYAGGNPLSYTDPNGLDLVIVYYPGVPGHIGVGVNTLDTVGHYPKKPKTIANNILSAIIDRQIDKFGADRSGGMCEFVPGVVKPDSPGMPVERIDDAEVLTIATTVLQDLVAQKIIERAMGNKPYSLCTDQCSSFVLDVLSQSGVEVPVISGPLDAIPGRIFERLETIHAE